MSTTPETVRGVLQSWLAVEVLTPQLSKPSWSSLAAEKQGQQRNKGSAALDGPSHWEVPGDDDPPPWRCVLEPPATGAPDGETPTAGPQQPRPWFSVILGAMPARLAFKHLDEAFAEQDGDEEISGRMDGNIIAGSVVLDECGLMVPDTLAIASFAWGLGQVLAAGPAAGLHLWNEDEERLKGRFGSDLTPTGPAGRARSLTWRDLRAVSAGLADELGVPPELWQVAPCAIEVISRQPPATDILSSFLLPDLCRVLRGVDELPEAAAFYLGLRTPAQPWNALSKDRTKLAALLQPELFPLGRWPGPGLHPLTLLQQAAVNAIVRDLRCGGIAAVNGPPGTGKTTLLRDLVANVVVARAEVLARHDDPGGNLSGLNLMDFAVVVASSNNAAVENVSLELPVRAKALDRSLWLDGGMEYFGRTADAVLGVAAEASAEERAWGLLAARLGNAKNRAGFFTKAWFDRDWGLRDWLDLAAWPDRQDPGKPPSKLAEIDPPPRPPEAMAQWRTARDGFRQALARCDQLRSHLAALSTAGSRLRDVEAQLPAAESRLDVAAEDLISVSRAAAAAQRDVQAHEEREAVEAGKLTTLASVAPSWFAKLLRMGAWTAHAGAVQGQVARLGLAQDAKQAADARLAIAAAERERYAVEHATALQARDAGRQEAARLASLLDQGRTEIGDALPGPGFWLQPGEALQQAAPWNGGAFRTARDDLFVAAMRLHRAFIVAAARTLKLSLNTVARAALGGPDAPQPSATDWGAFFLLVPVVSTTFASVGRMLRDFGAGEVGWLLIDEAGQATPQAAMGAIWRARRAVVIGDPLQIEPVVTTPGRTTRLIFEANGADPRAWAAPEQSAQTLADRSSQIQGRFRVQDRRSDQEDRVTGIPLLVHRRCERPMFDIANRIAYAGAMVFATEPGVSAIRESLGPSAWIDVDAPSSDKWVEAEGRLIAAAIARLSEASGSLPDLYVICPFKVPARRLRALLLDTADVLAGQPPALRQRWVASRVGTVHTFQGKEAEAVMLMLGAGRGARSGSRMWAGATPNLLNVAATRAKRALYVVGNREEWQGAGVFAQAVELLPRIAGADWLVSRDLTMSADLGITDFHVQP